jgi:hypothetical protein
LDLEDEKASTEPLGLQIKSGSVLLGFDCFMMQEHLKQASAEEKDSWTSARANFEITLELMCHIK